jgi:hypothetical protein
MQVAALRARPVAGVAADDVPASTNRRRSSRGTALGVIDTSLAGRRDF